MVDRRQHQHYGKISFKGVKESEDNCNLCILQGQAGVGKSVVIKKLIEELDKQHFKTLCIHILNQSSFDYDLEDDYWLFGGERVK